MPIIKVHKCYKWGKKGTLYCNDGRRKARQQGIAILISQGKINIKKKK